MKECCRMNDKGMPLREVSFATETEEKEKKRNTKVMSLYMNNLIGF